MAWGQRVKAKLKNAFGVHDDEAQNEDVEMQHGKQVQYRLEATVRNKVSLWKKILTCCGCCGEIIHPGSKAGTNPNERLARYLHWMFRVNFIFLFAIMCSFFFGLVIFFSGA